MKILFRCILLSFLIMGFSSVTHAVPSGSPGTGCWSVIPLTQAQAPTEVELCFQIDEDNSARVTTTYRLQVLSEDAAFLLPFESNETLQARQGLPEVRADGEALSCSLYVLSDSEASADALREAVRSGEPQLVYKAGGGPAALQPSYELPPDPTPALCVLAFQVPAGDKTTLTVVWRQQPALQREDPGKPWGTVYRWTADDWLAGVPLKVRMEPTAERPHMTEETFGFALRDGVYTAELNAAPGTLTFRMEPPSGLPSPVVAALAGAVVLAALGIWVLRTNLRQRRR